MSGIIGKNANRSSGVIGTAEGGIASLAADSSPQLGGFLDAAGNYIQMEKGGDISSASPTVIDTDGDFFAVTGTTNFSAFTVAADRHFFLEFGAVLTMTHGNGTLDLPGAANITTAASDVGEFISTAANVVTCVNYTKRDGTGIVAAGGGAWNLIGTAVASNSASLTITGIDSTYDTYAIAISDMVPSSDGEKFQLRLGDSSGVDSGASDYGYLGYEITAGSSSLSGSREDTMTGIRVGPVDVGNASGEGLGVIVHLHCPGDGTSRPMVTYNWVCQGTSTALRVGNGGGARLAVITVDRVQVLFDSGNIASGRMTVWGISHA